MDFKKMIQSKQGVCGLAAGLLAGFGFGGCDWRTLDETAEKAPVIQIEAPAGYEVDDMGHIVVPLPPDLAAGISARFAFFSTLSPNGGIATFDEAGVVSVTNIPVAQLGAFGGKAVAAAAPFGDNRILLGFPTDSRGAFDRSGSVAILTVGPTPVVAPFITSGDILGPQPINLGRAVAVGRVTGLPDVVDPIFASDTAIYVSIDGASAPAEFVVSVGCAIGGSVVPAVAALGLGNPMAAGDLIAGLPNDEIAIGVPRAGGGAGYVLVGALQAATEIAPASVVCPIRINAPDIPQKVDFGTSLTLADVGGPAGGPDGKLDLIVGAPPGAVAIYYGPLVEGVDLQPNHILARPPGTDSNFGSRVSTMQYDGIGGLDILVTALDATGGIPAVPGAGRVFAFALNGANQWSEVANNGVQRNDAEANLNLGWSAVGVPFAAPNCALGARNGELLVVGAGSPIFTYFRRPISQRDAQGTITSVVSTPDIRCLSGL